MGKVRLSLDLVVVEALSLLSCVRCCVRGYELSEDRMT